MKARPTIGFVALLVMAATAYVFYVSTKSRIVADDASIRLRSYKLIENTLKIGSKPEAWDAAVFVASKAVDRMIELLPGTTMSLGPAGHPEADLILNATSVEWDVGSINASLDLTAKFKSNGSEIGIVGDVLFVVKTVSADPDHLDTDLLILEPRLISVKPSLTSPIGVLTSGPRIGELLGLGLTAVLRDKMQIKIALRRSFPFSTLVDSAPKLPVGNGTQITLGVHADGEKISADLTYRPILTRGGIWALSDLGFDSTRDLSLDEAEVLAGPERDRVPAFRKEMVSKIVPFSPRNDSDVPAYLSGRMITKALERLNALSNAKRLISIHSTAVSGNLYENKWRDDILGDGGVFVYLTNPQAVSGTVSIGRATGAWDASRAAASVSIPIRIDGAADIHVHVDPLIGGGAGTSTGMKGNSQIDAKGSVSVREIMSNTGQGIFLVPDLTCQDIPLTIRTDGVLKIGPIATEVPSIGANLSFVVGKEQMEPIPLFDSMPRFHRLIPAATAAAPQMVTHSSGNDGLRFAFSDFALTSSKDGIWVSSNLNLNLVKMAEHGSPASAEFLNATEARDILARTRPSCTRASKFELLVGDIAIGKGNDAVKIFKAAGKALGDAKRATDKAADDTRRALEKAADDAARAAAKAADDAAVAATKALEDARRTVEKAWRDGTRALNPRHWHF